MKVLIKTTGNALVIVLIAIALLALLTFTVADSGRSNVNTDLHETNINVDEVLTWASSVKAAINVMMLANGSTETSISFEDDRAGQSGAATAATNTINPNSRGGIDEVFNTNDDAVGGPALWRDFSPDIPGLETTFFNGEHIIDGIGTNAADLAYFIPNIPDVFCSVVNRKAGLGTTDATLPVDNSLVTGHFKGVYGSATLDNIDGSEFGCVLNGTSRWFYYVMIAR